MNMKKIAGGLLMGIGAALVCGALILFLRNQQEDAQAGVSADRLLPQIVAYIEDTAEREDKAEQTEIGDTVEAPVYGTEMTEVMIDGFAYVGYLSIPALKLELPVMSAWNYDRLKIAPCRYYGSTKSDDMVIAAHNYSQHFGTLKNLSAGDAVYFTDMDGVVWAYAVTEIAILPPTAVAEMTRGDYDLTLFTCTYGGQSRVTVRCRRAGDA